MLDNSREYLGDIPRGGESSPFEIAHTGSQSRLRAKGIKRATAFCTRIGTHGGSSRLMAATSHPFQQQERRERNHWPCSAMSLMYERRGYWAHSSCAKRLRRDKQTLWRSAARGTCFDARQRPVECSTPPTQGFGGGQRIWAAGVPSTGGPLFRAPSIRPIIL